MGYIRRAVLRVARAAVAPRRVIVTETQATVRPWLVERDGDGRFVVVAPREHDHLLITDVLANLIPGQDKANAALIVRCVNQHAALVDALEAATNRLTGHAVLLEQFLADPAKEWTAKDPRTKEPIVTSALGNLRLQPHALRDWARQARAVLDQIAAPAKEE